MYSGMPHRGASRAARIAGKSKRRDRARARREKRRERQERARRRRYHTSGSEDERYRRRGDGSSWSGSDSEQAEEEEEVESRRLTAHCVCEEIDTDGAAVALRQARTQREVLPAHIVPGISVKWAVSMVADVLHLSAVPRVEAEVQGVLDERYPPSEPATFSLSSVSGSAQDLTALPLLPSAGSINGGGGGGSSGEAAAQAPTGARPGHGKPLGGRLLQASPLTPEDILHASPMTLPLHPRSATATATSSVQQPPPDMTLDKVGELNPAPRHFSRSGGADVKRSVSLRAQPTGTGFGRGGGPMSRSRSGDALLASSYRRQRQDSADTEKESDAEHAAAELARIEAEMEADAARREAERLEREARQRAARKAELEREASADVFIFPYGTAVFWGMQAPDELRLLALLSKKGLYEHQLAEPETDDMEFHYTPALRDRDGDEEALQPMGKTRLSGDDVELCSASPQEKLAVSYAFAQSTKLSVSERMIDSEIERSKDVPVMLARTGKIPLSASDISKQIGRLFILRTGVNLTSDILDSPEAFWDDDTFEPTYEMVQAYLDLSVRVDVLNTRLDIIRELLDMLNSQLETQHSIRLEWIVIWLIVAEVVLELASMLWNHFSRSDEDF